MNGRVEVRAGWEGGAANERTVRRTSDESEPWRGKRVWRGERAWRRRGHGEVEMDGGRD